MLIFREVRCLLFGLDLFRTTPLRDCLEFWGIWFGSSWSTMSSFYRFCWLQLFSIHSSKSWLFKDYYDSESPEFDWSIFNMFWLLSSFLGSYSCLCWLDWVIKGWRYLYRFKTSSMRLSSTKFFYGKFLRSIFLNLRISRTRPLFAFLNSTASYRVISGELLNSCRILSAGSYTTRSTLRWPSFASSLAFLTRCFFRLLRRFCSLRLS